MKWYCASAFVALLFLPALADDVSKVDHSTIDLAVKPGDDFFSYANGSWVKTAEIPAEAGSWGRLAEMRDQNLAATYKLLQDAAKDNTGWHDVQARQVGDFVTSFMDEEGIERKGLVALAPQLKKISTITTRRALAAALGRQMRADVDALNNTDFYTDNLFGLWVAPDFNDPDHYTAYLLQGGLGMPDRDYYLSVSVSAVATRAAYLVHVTNVLMLAGIPDPGTKAVQIVALETEIAKAHTSRADNVDVHKADNPWARSDFASKAPGIDWDSFFDGAGLAKQSRFIVWQPAAVTGIAQVVAATPLSTWRDYLTYHLLNHFSAYLPKQLADERFDFYGRVLTGTTEQRARWKRCVDTINTVLADRVGQIYVQHYFSSSARSRVTEMVSNIRTVYERRIDALDWMSPETRAKAKEKLTALYIGIGNPSTWRSYTGLAINPHDLAGNMIRSELFEYHRAINKLSQRVDRTEWSMTPQTVNAVNLPLQNALNFPAAYLRAPMFDPDADDAYNYGGIGVTIGHEISHAFDDQGSQFDAHGRLANWWTPDDFAHFQAAAERLALQYSAYCPFPDLCVNGHQTLSENIADVTGLSASYDAWRAAGAHAKQRGSLTGEQEFFLSYAQRWQVKWRDSALRGQILTDGHSPGQYRAQTVRNIDAWYDAFSVKKGDLLYLAPAERVKVW